MILHSTTTRTPWLMDRGTAVISYYPRPGTRARKQYGLIRDVRVKTADYGKVMAEWARVIKTFDFSEYDGVECTALSLGKPIVLGEHGDPKHFAVVGA